MMNRLIARLQGEVLHLRKQLKREGSNHLKQSRSQSQMKGILKSSSTQYNWNEEKNEESSVDDHAATTITSTTSDDDSDDEGLDDRLSMISQVLDDQLSEAPTIVMQGTREEAMQKALLSALYVYMFY